MTRDELETALDRGRLQAQSVNDGRWFKEYIVETFRQALDTITEE
jgi:hypothetical protein